jgi:hypothetical protein
VSQQSRRPRITWKTVLAFVLGFVVFAVPAALISARLFDEDPVPSFSEQMCGLPEGWLERIQRGHMDGRAGEISILAKSPAYFGSGSGGWSHSGPEPHLQEVPLVFYGPGVIEPQPPIDRPVTLADVAPTTATLLRGSIATDDGMPLPEVARFDSDLLEAKAPRLIVTVVLDGGGWNVLEQWPGDWTNILHMIENGVSYENATVGSSPSVTPSVHTTIGTGVFPWTHGITDIPVRAEDGSVVDSFEKGESSRFIEVPTLAERWDEQSDNKALVGMVGYEPWHVGMIGQGAEKPGGDKDDAVWLNTETNEWATNTDHYTLPDAISSTAGLDEDIRQLDAEDGQVDGAWGEHEILEDPKRREETPAFIRYHERAMENLITQNGYGDDEVTDLLYTNFKQIDRVGHYFNMNSPEVNESLLVTDEVLGDFVDFLDERLGRGGYVIVLTADHGQQPDAADIDGFSINPKEIQKDIEDEFGPVVETLRPTEIFLNEPALAERDATVGQVAEWLGAYTVADNLAGDERFRGAFEPGDRIFSLAVPTAALSGVTCGSGAGTRGDTPSPD